jgi:D-beta-D-heptose 7-phosphate kinase/D-beta-D-heptose 1-phosphate adenosyltransferase
MSMDLVEIVDHFKGLRIAMIGEAMLDGYIFGYADRLCPDAPVPVVAQTGRSDAPGGAANTAANLAALGVSVTLLSVVGDDPEGWVLRRELEVRGVHTESLLVQPARSTLAKHRVVANSQILVRYDQGSISAISAESEAALLTRLEGIYPSCDAVIVSDYGYGILTPAVIACLARLQAASPRLLIADARDLARYRSLGLTVAKPNYREAVALLGDAVLEGSRVRVQHIASSAERLLAATGAQLVAVTLDADGSLILDRDGPPYRTYAPPAPRPAPSGAGDTYVSAFATALAAGASAPQAAELATIAAATVVQREGTACCSAQDLLRWMAADQKIAVDPGQLAVQISRYRDQGRRIVFTNGCFDILHRGHITYLNRAKALGEILIVGVNSDASVRRLKGPERPINALDDRTQVLAGLSSIDHIVPFDADTPEELIRAFRPDIFVKGGDYRRETLPEAGLVEELGGTVQILAYVEDQSTTGIIDRIRGAALTQAPPVPRGDAS